MAIALVAIFCLVLSWAITLGVRSYAIRVNLLDHPNARSSHTTATARGGGLAIVVTFIMGTLTLRWMFPAVHDLLVALLPGACVVAVVGWWDDRRSLPARWRFLAHVAAATWALWSMQGVPPVPIFGKEINFGWLGIALAWTYLVWMINLCNFMDGIDGIAGIEALTVSLGGGLCWWLATSTPLWPVALVFSACVTGFLLLNFPPAKIFLGDVGSGFIGLVVGTLSLWSAQQASQVFWCWLILLGCFMVDATTTLIRRVRRGEKFYEPHRSHAYQYASRLHRSHRTVTLAVGVINVAWLLPVALLVAMRRLDGAVGTLIAYAPLVWLAYRYKAGNRAAQAA